jgi:protein transport protein SEC61 subunit alpha
MHACRPYVNDYSPEWLLSNEVALVAGAMIVNQIADYITELKLGNGTSILIFANIASYLPSSLGAAFAQAGESGSSSIAIYMIAFVLTTFGIVCVQARPCRAAAAVACAVRGARMSRMPRMHVG